jgi:DNA topoisomerase-1
MKNNQVPPSLVHVNDCAPGYRRIKKRDKFIYLDDQGKAVTSPKTVARIESLVIPPMWEDVWICKKLQGHLQATGRDAKGRKQYIYHPLWNEYFSELKYTGLVGFAQSLPIIRQQLKKDLLRRKWGKEKVAALAIKLMDTYYLRVGNKFYEEENGTYGISTLRKKHLKEEKRHLLLKYKAKSGKLRKISVGHPTLKKLLKQCSELPGYELFRYQTGGKYVPIDSKDINDYLRVVSGMDITAKNFRTWGGTVLTVKLEPQARQIIAEKPRRKMETTLLRLVANELNNTVAVCRDYYIHPKVMEAAIRGELANVQPLKNIPGAEWFSQDELKVLAILKEAENGLSKQKNNSLNHHANT